MENRLKGGEGDGRDRVVATAGVQVRGEWRTHRLWPDPRNTEAAGFLGRVDVAGREREDLSEDSSLGLRKRTVRSLSTELGRLWREQCRRAGAQVWQVGCKV